MPVTNFVSLQHYCSIHPVRSIQFSTAFSSSGSEVWAQFHLPSPSCTTTLHNKPRKGRAVCTCVSEGAAALSKFMPITGLFGSWTLCCSHSFFTAVPPCLWSSDSKCLLSCPTSRLLCWPPIPFAPLFNAVPSILMTGSSALDPLVQHWALLALFPIPVCE